MRKYPEELRAKEHSGETSFSIIPTSSFYWASYKHFKVTTLEYSCLLSICTQGSKKYRKLTYVFSRRYLLND